MFNYPFDTPPGDKRFFLYISPSLKAVIDATSNIGKQEGGPLLSKLPGSPKWVVHYADWGGYNRIVDRIIMATVPSAHYWTTEPCPGGSEPSLVPVFSSTMYLQSVLERLTIPQRRISNANTFQEPFLCQIVPQQRRSAPKYEENLHISTLAAV